MNEVQTTISEMVIARFRDAFGDELRLDASLARYTSARVGGIADMFLMVHNVSDLQMAVEMAHAQSVPYTILGGGSNVLVADSGVRGLVIMNRAREVKFRNTGFSVICTVESGMNLSSLPRQCIARGLGG